MISFPYEDLVAALVDADNLRRSLWSSSVTAAAVVCV